MRGLWSLGKRSNNSMWPKYKHPLKVVALKSIFDLFSITSLDVKDHI
jgi:hypothetical protein